MKREHKLGVMDCLINASRRKEIPVRIICPLGDKNSKTLEYISTEAPKIKILNGEKALYFTQSRTKDTGDLCDEILQKEVMGNYLYRYELSSNGTRLINPKLLLALPATLSALHNGGKILIGPDNNVYLIVGDLRFQQTKAQNKINGTDPNGSGVIYRITQVGKPASGNPFGDGVESMVDKFYAYGIRNSFGMDFDPVTGKLWDTENGEDNYDEINLVEPGFNSGWTKIQGLAKYAPAGFNINGSLVKYLSDQNIREGKIEIQNLYGI
jgi:aldose sugar dehydrogenase